MYPNLSPNNGYRRCPLGKLSHLGLEQLRSVSIEGITLEKYSALHQTNHHIMCHVKQCIVIFCIMTENNMTQPLQHTVNSLLDCFKTDTYVFQISALSREIRMDVRSNTDVLLFYI